MVRCLHSEIPNRPHFDRIGLADVFSGRLQQSVWCLTILLLAGCGTAVQRNGTEQLLLSDSVDRAIDQLDLSPLAGRKVYLDIEYMKPVKTTTFINAEYINSALRQKLTTSGCLIQTDRAQADYILEPRVGALASDSMEITYGVPSSGGVGTAASALTGAPAFSIPEMSFGKRNSNTAVSKVVVYAYHRETGLPVWQSGNAVAKSDAQDSWFLGVGPVTRGSLYDGVQVAGNKVRLPFEKSPSKTRTPRPLTIADSHQFVHPAVLEKQLADAAAAEDESAEGNVQPASHEQKPGDPAAAAGGPAAGEAAPAQPAAEQPAPANAAPAAAAASAPAAAAPVAADATPPTAVPEAPGVARLGPYAGPAAPPLVPPAAP